MFALGLAARLFQAQMLRRSRPAPAPPNRTATVGRLAAQSPPRGPLVWESLHVSCPFPQTHTHPQPMLGTQNLTPHARLDKADAPEAPSPAYGQGKASSAQKRVSAREHWGTSARLNGRAGRDAGVCLLVPHVTEGKRDTQRGAATCPRSHSTSEPGPESKAGAPSVAQSHCEHLGRKEQPKLMSEKQ